MMKLAYTIHTNYTAGFSKKECVSGASTKHEVLAPLFLANCRILRCNSCH